MGKVFIQHQDTAGLATRKWKKQKPGAAAEEAAKKEAQDL